MEMASCRYQPLLCWSPRFLQSEDMPVPYGWSPWESSASSAWGRWTESSILVPVPSPGTNTVHNKSLSPKILGQPSSPGTHTHEQSQPLQCDLYLKDSDNAIESMLLYQELCIGAALQCQHQDSSSCSSYPNPPRPADPRASTVPANLHGYLWEMMGLRS